MPLFPMSETAAVTDDGGQREGNGNEGAVDGPSADVVQERDKDQSPAHAHGREGEGDQKDANGEDGLVDHGRSSSSIKRHQHPAVHGRG